MLLDADRSLRLITLAKQYLDKNPQRYTEKEKVQFMNKLLESIKGDQNFMYDEVYDFLVYYNLVDGISRHKNFVRYINKHYHPFYTPRILDVGAGRLCELSSLLQKHGYNMFAMDPNIRLLPHEAKDLEIHISKDLFLCDKFAKNKKGTDVSKYDLLIGLEPCLATEHIIHQGLKYEKPFEVVLCYEAHKALNGKQFRTVDEWFEHLLKISSEVEIIKNGGDYIARHVDHKKFLSKEFELPPNKDKKQITPKIEIELDR